MIRTLPNILINGSNQVFSGLLYNLDYQINFGQSPSTLTAHFVSQDGTYQDPQLSTINPYNVKIGDTLNLNMYAVDYTKTESSKGNILNVKFMDGSFILDKTFVGLYKRHGDIPNYPTGKWAVTGAYQTSSSGSGFCIIIVGQEFHPCDTNKDGHLNYIGLTGTSSLGIYQTGFEYSNFVSPVSGMDNVSGVSGITGIIGGITINAADNLDLIDACDPCPSNPVYKYFQRCANMDYVNIWDVGVNFDMIYDAVSGAGITWGTDRPFTNPYYFTQYQVGIFIGNRAN